MAVYTICCQAYCGHTNAAFSRYCSAHKCPQASCNRNVSSCTEHVCLATDCTQFNDGTSNSYCVTHKCVSTGCMHRKPCPVHSCEITHCLANKVEGFKWCAGHKCRRDNCSALKTECRVHTCGTCRVPMDAGELYCLEHKCPHGVECNYGLNRCPEHNCTVNRCQNRNVERSPYCIAHKCIDRDCSLSRKCHVHLCVFRDCTLPKASVGDKFCTSHKCKKCPSRAGVCRQHRCRHCRQSPIVNGEYDLCSGCMSDLHVRPVHR